MRFSFLYILLILSFGAQARLLQNEITGRETSTLSFRESCESLGHQDSLLVDPVGTDQLDCMGKKISIIDVCLKKREAQFLKVSLLKNEVLCEYGKQVFLTISCDERDAHYCSESLKSCEKLQKIFALKLNLFRHSVVSREKEKVLNCLFDESK